MKIKLDQLKKIIREELAGELSENTSNDDSEGNAAGLERGNTLDVTDSDDEKDSNVSGMGKISEEEGSSDLAEAIAALEAMHQNLEGIIARLKEDPNAPLGTDVAMAHWGLDD
tara:strand:- start:544 stop:882 length:339 start_codon:yes stop_codon:yes gene_type:complete